LQFGEPNWTWILLGNSCIQLVGNVNGIDGGSWFLCPLSNACLFAFVAPEAFNLWPRFSVPEREMIHLHLLYIFIQSSFKFTIKFVGPTINLKVKLKITFLEAISLSQFSNVLFIHHFDLHQVYTKTHWVWNPCIWDPHVLMYRTHTYKIHILYVLVQSWYFYTNIM
jgi:hypothetical protein